MSKAPEQSVALRATVLVAACLIALCSALFAVQTASAEDAGPDFGRVLSVKFKPGTTAVERAEARDAVDADFAASLAAAQLQQVTIPRSGSVIGAAMELRANENVDFVSLPGTWELAEDPTPYFDDPYLPKQWALLNYGQVFMTEFNAQTGSSVNVSGVAGADIDAPSAWAAADHDAEPIGVIDTGVAYEHEDLAANVLGGHDFFDADDDPSDMNGHGTHVASLAAAAGGNGKGIAGADPWGGIVALRAADENGQFAWAAIEQAVTWGLANGVRVFNGSFGGPDDNPAFNAIMQANPNALFIFSAGNGGGDKVGDDHDTATATNHRYPCDSTLDNVICVAATDWEDKLAKFSDFGVKSVDIAAPGSRVYGAKPCLNPAPVGSDPDDLDECPNNDDDPYAPVGIGGGPGAYQLLSGTSMAAPQVSGTAALLWATYPTLHASQIKSAIVKHTDSIDTLTTKIAYGGRLDAGKAMAAAAAYTGPAVEWPVPPAQPSGPGPDNGGGGGGGDDGGTVIPPLDTNKPPAKPLTFTVIRPKVARIGRSKRVKFKLRCSTACSAAVTVRPDVIGLKSFKGKLRRGSGTRAVTVTIPSGRLKALRSLLHEGLKPRLNFSIVVADKSGNKSTPTIFTVKLAL